MSSIYSLLWIGPADGLATEAAAHTPSLDVTWVRDASEALALTPSSVQDFDVALLDGETAALLPAVQRLGKQPRFPPLLVRLDEQAAAQRPGLLAAGAAEVLVVPAHSYGRNTTERQRRGAREELLRGVRQAAVGGGRGANAASRASDKGRGGEPSQAPAHCAAPDDDPQRELDFKFEAPRELSTFSGDAFGGVIGRSPSMRPVFALVERARHSLATVLLSGETGTGKEVVAKAIHGGSPRQDHPFVAVNCAAFPEALLESELFGHVKGAFTSAHRNRMGLFEAANGGTLFLDEIGETPPALQAKLLRVLQEREVRPVGASRSRRVNVRVISATNRSLNHNRGSESFRRDLYYRLAVFPIEIPPLRQRVEDILPLAEHFLALHGAREDKPHCHLSASAEHLLLAHAWPGNVRELENEMQRALALVEAGDAISAKHLSATLADALAPIEANVTPEDSLRDNMRRVEAWMIRQSLARQGGRRAATARKLGITREGLYKKMKRLNIE